MSADRLALPLTAAAPAAVFASTERAVLAVSTGTPLRDAAVAEGMDPTVLTEAVEVYRSAGRRALEDHVGSDWWQVYVEFTDWNLAERVCAEHIAPMLHSAEEDGVLGRWWFMRKHPCWRLRLHPGCAGALMRARLGEAFDGLAADGRIARWWTGIYEAETAAFGSRDGMEPAHDLFCEDSRAVLAFVRDGEVGLGRRELSLLLCSVLFRASGLEWYEQGDVWHRVTLERPLPPDVPTSKVASMASDLRQLMLADITPEGPLLGAYGPLSDAAGWADAFRRTGRALGKAAREGTLQRGLREVTSYAVIFHWNRLGLPSRTQSILAHAARIAILGTSPGPVDGAAADRSV